MLATLLSQQAAGFTIRLLSETATTVTVGWDPYLCDGFRFVNQAGKRSHTWDGSRTSVRFARVPGVVTVEPLTVTDSASHRVT